MSPMKLAVITLLGLVTIGIVIKVRRAPDQNVNGFAWHHGDCTKMRSGCFALMGLQRVIRHRYWCRGN
jgi:hypothetical protein